MDKKVDDSSSPVGILEDYFKSEESETSSSKQKLNLILDFECHQSSKLSSRLRVFIQSLRSKSKNHLASLRRSTSMRFSLDPNILLSADSCNSKTPKNFSLYELQTATNNFSQKNLIGKGGYAEVYKGCLSNGQFVAIKRLTRGTVDDIVGDFLSELGIMAHVNHPNTAKLIGYGIEGGMHLVLELSLNGSLASMLYGPKNELKWSIRYKIALGTAEGLLYLHEGCKRRVIHRDIKAANVLLTENFEPQICDFGLAKWLPEKWTHHVISKFEGTFGYLAPEFLMHGIVDEKTDVFSFGVLLLELVTGRRALDYSQQSLVMWAKPLLKNNDVRELIDPSLGNDYNSRQLNLVLLAAALCIQQSSIRRPQISQSRALDHVGGTQPHVPLREEMPGIVHPKYFPVDADYTAPQRQPPMPEEMPTIVHPKCVTRRTIECRSRVQIIQKLNQENQTTCTLKKLRFKLSQT